MERKINILYISSTGRIWGGGEKSLLILLKNLNRDKFRLSLICPSEGRLVTEAKNLQVPSTVIKIKSLKRLHLLSFINAIRKICQLIRAQEIDLIHCNSGATREAVCAILAAKICKIPFIWHARIIDSAKLIDPIIANLSTKIICISKAVSERFKWLKHPDKLVIVFNAVDLDEFNPSVRADRIRKEFGLNSNTLLVGIVGRLEPCKGQHLFIEMAAKINQMFREVKFLIVGEDFSSNKIYRKKLEQMVKTKGFSSNVIFTGLRDDIPEIMSALDIFVLTSLEEHFGRVVIEAMAASKPVVATNSGGVPEIVEDGKTGILVPPKKVEAMVVAVADLLRDKEKRESFGRQGLKRVKDFFSIEFQMKKIEEIYLELAKK